MPTRRLRVWPRSPAALLLGALARPVTIGAAQPAAAPAPPRRIISLVPALTEMLFAIGAGPQVVAVSSFDTYPPEVAPLPRVGALLDPDVERVLSLTPDLVAIYGTQTDLKRQLERASIPGLRLPARRPGRRLDDDPRARRRAPVVAHAPTRWPADSSGAST